MDDRIVWTIPIAFPSVKQPFAIALSCLPISWTERFGLTRALIPSGEGLGVGLSVARLTNPPRPAGTPPRRGFSVFLLHFGLYGVVGDSSAPRVRICSCSAVVCDRLLLLEDRTDRQKCFIHRIAG